MSTSFDIEKFIKGEIALNIPEAGGKCYFKGKIFRTPVSFISFDTIKYEELEINYIIEFHTKEYPIGAFLIPKDSIAVNV